MIVIILTLILSSLAFSQSLTPAQIAQMRAMQSQNQGGALSNQNGTLSQAEIAAARETMMRNQNAQSIGLPGKTLIMEQDSLLLFLEKFAVDSIFVDSSLFGKDSVIARYENIIFSQSLPTVFYELQGMVPADYPLKPGDNLELSLWGAVEKQFALSVNNQGNVFVEGVGLVNVGNLKLGEAEKTITKKLQSVYSGIVQGRISVNLRTTKLSPTKVFVMGSVQRPGGYDLPGNANVFLALYRAGGLDDIGSARNIVIRRANGDSSKVDLYDFLLKGKKIGEGILRDGDLIFVPKAEKLVKATGTIGRPAIYELKGNETLGDLLSFAGGLRPTADHTVNLWRINETGISEVFEPGMARDFADGGKTFQMQDGDSLFIFANTKPGKNSIQVFGAVFYPAFYTWTEGMGIAEAVALAGGLATEAFLGRAVVERLNPDSSFSYFADDFKNTFGLKLLPNDKVIVLDSRVLKNFRTISIAGYVKNPQDFIWQEGINAIDLIALCGGFLPEAEKNEIIVERLILGKQATQIIKQPLKNELNIKSGESLILKPGDRVIVKKDTSYYEQEIIALEGAFKNPGSYSLEKRGETLKEFISRVALIDPSGYIKGSQIFRQMYEVESSSSDNLRRMLFTENNAVGNMGSAVGNMGSAVGNMGSAVGNMGSAVGNKKRYRIDLDFDRILQGKDKDIALQGGDSIFVPFEMLTVNLTGEVTSPGHILWKKGWSAKDYINAAGGLTINGDDDRIVLTYANGQKTNIQSVKRDPDPGSVINVSYKPTPEPTKLTEVIQVVGVITTTLTALTTLIILLITK